MPNAIIEPLFTIFTNCLNVEYFQINGKKQTLSQFLKNVTDKTSKTMVQSLFFQSVARYSNASYAIILKHFLDNNLTSPKQSGFRHGDSCINQLLSITHDIFTSFDNGLEEGGVFLNISKSFDKV